MPFGNPVVKIRFWTLLLSTVSIYLPIAALLTLAVGTVIRIDWNSRSARLEARERARIEIARVILAKDFSETASDLKLLAELPALRAYLHSGREEFRKETAGMFLNVAEAMPHYDQLRLLDLLGKEVIRVNYGDGKPYAVPSDQLQDKSARYYFRETLELERNEIFVSPLDLNIEHEQLEIPYKPMIRFGTPVFDGEGRKRGIVVINYFGEILLQNFRETMQGGDPRRAMLLDREGYWLSSPQRDEEWGAVLGKPENRFGRDFGEEWRVIASSEEGALQTENGLFVYATVRPMYAVLRAFNRPGEPLLSDRYEASATEYVWKIVSFLPKEVLSAGVFYHQAYGRVLILAVYALLVLASAMAAYALQSRQQIRLRVREDVERLREIAGTLAEGLLVTNPAGRIALANPEACAVLGYSPEEFQSEDMHSLLHAHCARNECGILRVGRVGGRYEAEEDTFRSKAGTLLPVSLSAAAIVREQQVAGIVVAFRDIRERKLQEQALRQSAAEIEDLYDHAPCGYHSLDRTGLYVRINRTELAWLGYRREELIGRMRFPDLLTPATSRVFEENFPRFLACGEVHNLEFEMVRRDGTLLPVLLSATAVRDANGQFLMSRSTLFDLTERKRLESEIQRQARTDTLTGLHNRRYFFELAERELARGRRYNGLLAVLMLDLDHFKAVNDAYGHHAGDRVLRGFGEILARSVRDVDIAGRIGGEEFAVVLPEARAEQAVEVAERVRLAVAGADLRLEQGEALHVTVSIGVAAAAAAESDIEALLDSADQALYEAKRAGRNRVCIA